MRVELHPEALTELDEATEWLDTESTQVADDFLAAVDAQLAQISRFPFIAARVRLAGMPETVRQSVLQKYHYLVIYRVEAQRIQVIAIAHMRRRPGYWRGRLD